MKTKLVFCLAAVVALAAPGSAATSPLSAATSAWSIDGAAAGVVLGWEGGDVHFGATATSGAGTATGKLSYAPLTVRVPFPPAPEVAAWVNEMAAGQSPQRTVVVADADASGRLVEAYELSGAALVEVEFPEFNAARTTLAVMRLVFAGASGRTVPPPAALGALTKTMNTAGFQLSLQGVDGTGVSRIEAIRIVQPGAPAPSGPGMATGKTGAGTGTSSVVITVSRARVASWQAWLSDAMKQTSGAKRDGAIALLDATMKVSTVTLNLYGCSLVRLSRPPDSAGVPAFYLAELVCERVALGGLPAPTAGAAASAITTKQAAVGAIAGGSTVQAAPTSGAIATVEPERGSRDPALFPRLSGLRRTGYSGTFQKTHTNETAGYAAQEKILDLVARVEAAATAAGWELRNLTESGTSTGRQMTQSWVRNNASAELTFFEMQGGAVTQMNLAVIAPRTQLGGSIK